MAGQVLKGRWVEESQQRIEQHRKTDVRVIVMDERGTAEGASVHIQQLRHDFPVGFVVPTTGLPEQGWDRPVWRCFNAVSLDNLGDWPAVQPQPGEWNFEAVERVVRAALDRDLRVRFGGVFSADAGRMPPWVLPLEDSALRSAVDAHLMKVLGRFGQRVGAFDLLTHSLSHEFFASRLGPAMIRDLFERGKAAAPQATLCIRYEDALTPVRVTDMLGRVTELRQAFIPVDGVALEQRLGGILQQAPLARAIDLIAGQHLDVVIASVEVGGGGPAAAALNLETFLRTAFAYPNVRGVYFAGLTDDNLLQPEAALLNPDGSPTRAGQVFDGLFHQFWWTDQTITTDELGNARARVFTGTHRITAKLPDGRTLEMTAYLPRRDPSLGPRIVLLEPLKP